MLRAAHLGSGPGFTKQADSGLGGAAEFRFLFFVFATEIFVTLVEGEKTFPPTDRKDE